MRRYWFILCVVFVSESPILGRFPFSRVPVLFLILFRNPCLLLRYPVLYRVLRAVPRVVRGGGGRGCGGPCVDSRRLQPRTWCYPGMQFNLSVRFLIPGPSPAPVPARDWGAELRGSSVSRTLQRRLRCVCLSTPVLAKWVLPFSLPLIDSIERPRQGIPSLSFLPLKEQ